MSTPGLHSQQISFVNLIDTFLEGEGQKTFEGIFNFFLINFSQKKLYRPGNSGKFRHLLGMQKSPGMFATLSKIIYEIYCTLGHMASATVLNSKGTIFFLYIYYDQNLDNASRRLGTVVRIRRK